MNKCGRAAQEHWARHRPPELAQLKNSTLHFTSLREKIEQRTLNLSGQLAGPDPAGEGDLEKVGRLNAATARAQEIVLTETLWTDTTTEEPGEDAAEANRTDLFQQRMEVAL